MFKVMATIKCFEDVEAWKIAREFYNVIRILLGKENLKKTLV